MSDHLHFNDATQADHTAAAAGVGFAGLGLRSELLGVLDALGYEEPTPIQREAIPALLRGRDLVGQAATGTGKTAAFALPLLHSMPPGGEAAVLRALVLVPTRELAVQVSEAVYRYGRALGTKVVPVYGGQPIHRQIAALRGGVHVVVATPGRAIDHIKRGSLDLGTIEVVVLDEADEMLDMGFAEDIEAILSATPAHRQTVLFSATMPPRIDAIAARHLHQPQRISIGRADAAERAARVRQVAYVVQRAHKAAALGRVLDVEAPAATIVFCRTRGEVDELTETMNGRGYRAEALHGGMSQEQRDRVMGRLRAGTAELLVATDVAARGLDVDLLTHVVNYDVPSAPESYVHRIGRVGRAGREGVAITLAEPREQRLLGNIERLTGEQIGVERVPTVSELHARRLHLTSEAIREAAGRSADDGEPGAAVDALVDALGAELGLRQVALGAMRLLHSSAMAGADHVEIPEPPARRERAAADERDDRGRTAGARAGRFEGGRERRATGRERAAPGGRGEVGRVYVGLGRSAGIRPGDLVGAITGETDLTGSQIGPIKVAERFSVVGVPAPAIERVIAALRGTTLKGRRPTVRRYTEQFHR